MASGENIVVFAKRAVNARVAPLGEQIARARPAPGVEQVHDLRVAARRTAYALASFRALLECRDWRRLRKRARAILRAGAAVRDRDIALGLAADAGLGPASELAEGLAEQREAAARALRDELERKRYRRFAIRWTRRIDRIQPGGESSARGRGAAGTRRLDWDAELSCTSNAARLLPGQAARYLAHGRDACQGSRSPEQLHRLRLEGKRLRYTLELFREVYGTSLREILAPLKRAQKLLGGISDCDATENLIRERGLAASRGGRKLLAAMREERARSIDSFLAAWQSLAEESDPERLWERTLANPGGRSAARRG